MPANPKDPLNTYPVSADLRRRIKARIAELGLKQNEVAKACRIKPSSLNDLLSGESQSARYLRQLCRILRWNFHEVLPLDEDTRALLSALAAVRALDADEAAALAAEWVSAAKDRQARIRMEGKHKKDSDDLAPIAQEPDDNGA